MCMPIHLYYIHLRTFSTFLPMFLTQKIHYSQTQLSEKSRSGSLCGMPHSSLQVLMWQGAKETRRGQSFQKLKLHSWFSHLWTLLTPPHLLRILAEGLQQIFSLDNRAEHLGIPLSLFLNTAVDCLEALTLTSKVSPGPLQRSADFLLVYVEAKQMYREKTHVRQGLRHGKLQKTLCYEHMLLRGVAGKGWGNGEQES